MAKHKPIYSVQVLCAKCKQRLYSYDKEGPGRLMKCFVDRIKRDRTHGDRRCPNCGELFAREDEIKGRPTHKIIQGKVVVKGHCPK